MLRSLASLSPFLSASTMVNKQAQCTPTEFLPMVFLSSNFQHYCLLIHFALHVWFSFLWGARVRAWPSFINRQIGMLLRINWYLGISFWSTSPVDSGNLSSLYFHWRLHWCTPSLLYFFNQIRTSCIKPNRCYAMPQIRSSILRNKKKPGSQHRVLTMAWRIPNVSERANERKSRY